MRNREINSQLTRLNALLQRTTQVGNYDPETQAHWARYLCILTAGLIENALKELYSDYARRSTSGPVAKFVAAQLDLIRSPKAGRFVEIAGYFKQDWKDELQQFVDDMGR